MAYTIKKEKALERVFWAINLRYVIVAVFTILGTVNGFIVGAIPQLIISLSLAAIVLIYNFGGFLFLKRKETALDSPQIVLVGFWQLVADVFIFTLLVYITGGILSPFVIAYLIPLVMAGILSPQAPASTRSIALLCILFFEGLICLEFLGILKPMPIIKTGLAIYQDLPLFLSFLFIFPAVIIGASYLATALASYLKEETEGFENKVEELTRVKERMLITMEELERKAVETSVLYEVTAKLSLMPGVIPGLEMLLERIIYLTQSNIGMIYFLSERESEAEVAASRGLPIEMKPPLKIPLPAWVTTQIIKPAKPVVLTKVTQEEQLIYLPLWKTPVRVVLFIPLKFGKKVVGILELCRFSPREFTLDEQRVLTILADKLASFIEYERADRARNKAEMELKERITEIQGLYEKLKVVDRMKTEFLSMISHELKTPLTPICGYLDLLQRGVIGPISEEQKNVLLIMDKQSRHLNSLIDSILDISRLELGKPVMITREPLSLKRVLEETVEAMRFDIEGRGVKLEVDIAPDLPSMLGDEIKLRRLITNLLGNAIKFTPRGGEITIKAFEDAGFIQVQIIDTGIGIPAEQLEKIFEKFYQVDSSYARAAGGIGMGLTIAKEIVEAHGGKIWAESKGLGHGSKFCFRLPLGGVN